MADKTSIDWANAANAKALHFLGGWWKCEECGLLIEDNLYVCPECDAKKPTGLTLDQQEEMIADNGFEQ